MLSEEQIVLRLYMLYEASERAFFAVEFFDILYIHLCIYGYRVL